MKVSYGEGSGWPWPAVVYATRGTLPWWSTQRTPGTVSASLVSIETMRAWAWGLQSTFTKSAPSSAMSSA